MEDTEELLKTAINLHYRNHPEVIADAMKVVENYCSQKQTNCSYDKVLKILHDLMNDLPPNILLYFLTTIPLPNKEDCGTSTLSELIKKSRISLLDKTFSMQSVLNEYIINTMPSLLINTDNNVSEDENIEAVSTEEIETAQIKQEVNCLNVGSLEAENSLKLVNYSFEVPEKNSRMTLLNLCAEYVVSNLDELKEFYNNKNKNVWGFVNRSFYSREERGQCYKYVQDINRKLEWLRMIEAGHVSVHVIRELYGDSDIFLKERFLCDILDETVFNTSDELKEAIQNFVYN